MSNMFSPRRRSTLEREMGVPLSVSYDSRVGPTVATAFPLEGAQFGYGKALASPYQNPDAIDFDAMQSGLLGDGSTIDVGVPNPPLNLLDVPTDFSSRIRDVRRDSGLAQLSGNLMGLAMPVRRGESRLQKSLALGQQMGAQAAKEGRDILSSEVAIDKYQRARDKAIRQKNIMGQLFGADGQTGAFSTSYQDSFDYQKLPEENRQYFDRSMQFKALGDAYTQAGDMELAKNAYEQANALRDQSYSGFLDPAERAKSQTDQRETWRKTELANRQSVVESYNKVAALSQRGGGLADYASLIEFIKGLDPTSVVREGEVSMAASFQSLQNRLSNALEKAQTGGFDPKLRQQMVEITREMAELATKDYGLAVQRQTPLIERDRLDPQQIIVEITPMAPLPTSYESNLEAGSVLTDLENE